MITTGPLYMTSTCISKTAVQYRMTSTCISKTAVQYRMTPTYNSKTAIQYHMIDNNCPLFPLLAKHPFSLLPQIRTLRQVANKLHGYIYSALATYFMQSYIYIMRTSMATCSDYIIFNAVVSAAAPLIIPSSAYAGKLCAVIICSKF